MQLAIGDVVRVRKDMTLGTVAGVADRADGNLVVLQLSGGELRRVQPHDLEVVGRCAPVLAAGRSVAALVVMVVAFFAALFGSLAGAHSGVLLSVLAGLGCYSVVMTTYQLYLRITAPRRIRV